MATPFSTAQLDALNAVNGEAAAEIMRLRSELHAANMRLSEASSERDDAREALAECRNALDEQVTYVSRVWKALGIKTYEQADGKAIDDIVAERCVYAIQLRELLTEADGWLAIGADEFLHSERREVMRLRTDIAAALAKNPAPAASGQSTTRDREPETVSPNSAGAGPDEPRTGRLPLDTDRCALCGWIRVHHSQARVACVIQDRNGMFASYHPTNTFRERTTPSSLPVQEKK